MERKARWANKEKCMEYLSLHKPTGLTLCAAADFLGSRGRDWYDSHRGLKKKEDKDKKEASKANV